MFAMENKSAGGEENVVELQSDADDSARGCAPVDEVASAVAAVSDEIGDILKDELGDADRADRIELELADLSAELGILAGLADGEAQPVFPSLFEMAMVQNDSNSSTSSVDCNWTNRRRPRPHNAKRAIAKGKESRRRKLGRRATRLPQMPDGLSDISDVGADCDSDEHQWTDTTASSESSSAKEGVADLENMFSKAEAPPMGQFLLPLLTSEPGASPPTLQNHRHADIWQLMMGEEEMVVTEFPLVQEMQPCTSSEIDEDSIIITPEDEVALLNFVCEGNDPAESVVDSDPEPLPNWLQALYRAWGELGALLYTLVGDGASGWTRSCARVSSACSCAPCLARAHHHAHHAALLHTVIATLYTDETTMREAAILFKALKVTCRSDLLKPFVLDCRQLNVLTMSQRGTAIVFDALKAMASRGEVAREMVETVCRCDPCLLPMDMEHAVKRFVKILKCYAASSIILFKVEMYADNDETSAPTGIRYLSHPGPSARDRLLQIATRAKPAAKTAWSHYNSNCDCKTATILSNEERKTQFRHLFFRMMRGVKTSDGAKRISREIGYQINDADDVSSGGEMLDPAILDNEFACYNMNEIGELLVKNDWTNDEADSKSTLDLDEDSDLNSLNLTSSSLESSSAAEASSLGERSCHGGELVRTVRHLMRSIASIERLMERVLKLQDHSASMDAQGASMRVDLGLSEVDKKLMAMYKRLPGVHRKQLHVYKKQKKLSTACSLVVGGRAPSPPAPPVSAPPPLAPDHALTYHLHRFHEVRHKVMHMKEQQLYYHRLRIWLEDQLKQTGDNNANQPNIKLIDDIKLKRRTSPRRITKHKSSNIKPYKILELLKQKAPSNTEELLEDLQDDSKSDVDPPDAFTIEKDDLSDTETIVGEEMCKEMKECLAKFASFALSEKSGELKEFPEAISPPLHEISPTNTEPMPVYSPNPNQRLLTVNKLLKRHFNKDDRRMDFNNPGITEIFNVAPINARRTPMLVEQIDKTIDIKASEAIQNEAIDVLVEQEKESIIKKIKLGLEMKKAFDEYDTIINTFGAEEVQKKAEETENLTLEQISTTLLNIEKDPFTVLGSDLDNEFNRNLVTKIIENLPQMIADLPKNDIEEIKTPKLVSIINDLPELANEDQLSPETLKQIRELKLTKNREKVTKNTSKRKSLRRPKANFDDISMTLEFNTEDLKEIMAKGGKGLQTMLQNQTEKEEFKHVIFSLAGKYALDKLFGHLKDETNPDIIGFLHLHKVKINTFMLSKASSLFDDYVKEAMTIKELMNLVRQRLLVWLNKVFVKYYHVKPVQESEIDDAIVNKFYEHVKEIAEKQCSEEGNCIDDLEDLRYLHNDKGSLKNITKLLSTSAGSAFDLIIMKLSHMSKDKKSSVSNLKFKYMEVISRCSESPQLASWIVLNPEIAANVILEMTGLPTPNEKPAEVIRMDVSSMSNHKKQEFFMNKVREMNKYYLSSLPKNALSSGEWLLLLYRLEQLESKLNDALTKSHAPKPVPQSNVSETHEAEVLAARGLSKIIGINTKPVKKDVKTEPVKNVNVKPVEVKPENVEPKLEESKPKVVLEKIEKAQLNEALYAKYENVLKSNGHKELLELFYKIKSYLSKGQPVPECYTNQYIDMCSNIDMSLLNFELSPDLTKTDTSDDTQDVDAKNLSVIGSQNPELLAKYTAQALRNAKQTLNAVAFEVAFKNAHRNGSKSESDVCDAPKNDCNWTNDCICNTCQESDVTGSCLGDIVKQCYDMEAKSKAALDDKKKEPKVKQPVKPAKPSQPKPCDNVQHQQHVCKMGHSPSGSGSCASEGAPDQPCTCCYCTVFGHAPPVTTPVPRNFNETRERLRLILSKKKQKTGKPAATVAAAEPPLEHAKVVTAITQMIEKSCNNAPTANPKVKLEQNAQTKTQIPTKPSPQTQPPLQQPQTHQPQQPSQQKPQVQQPSQQNPQIQPPWQQKPVQQPSQQKPQVQQPNQQKPQIQQPSPQKQVQQPIQHKPQIQQPSPQKPQIQQPSQQKSQIQQPSQQKPQIHQPMQQKPQPLQQKPQPLQQKPQPLQQKPRPMQQKTQPLQQTAQVQQKVVGNAEMEQRLLQERMAKMTVTDHKPKPLNITPQVQAPEVGVYSAANSAADAKIDALIKQQQLKQQQLLLQQQQLKQAQQQQQLQQQQQWLNQQQQMLQRRRGMSISSCCSGSSHSSGESYWRGHEDPRDLDALLQYIEGPTRHVDRGKKRAKKERQRAKKTEHKMLSSRATLVAQMSGASRFVSALRGAVRAAASRRDALRIEAQALRPKQGKKGKKPKLNPTQQAKAQQIAEQLGELNILMTNTQKELTEAEAVLAKYTQCLEECDAQLREARDLLHGPRGDKSSQISSRHRQEMQAHQRQQHMEDVEKERQIMNNIIMTGQTNRTNNPYSAVDIGQLPQMRAIHTNKELSTGLIECEDLPPQPKQAEGKEKKQTWEQALAHMNQLVTNANKEKQKKQKEAPPKAEVKPAKEPTRSQSLPDDTQNLSKKQRKLLARQQAEEEEARLLKQQQQQEAKNKKSENKKQQEPAKSDKGGKKADKMAAAEQNGVAGNKDGGKEKQSKDKKGKENKLEKNAQQTQPQPKQPKAQPAPPPPPQPLTKKERKKNNQQSQPQPQQQPQKQVNSDSGYNHDDVGKMNSREPKAAANNNGCSIMEQLSSGVDVSELRLPPGITLTRVQPNERQRQTQIHSVPLWKSNQLPVEPTPVARPPPVIEAHPSMMMFTQSQINEPPKTIIMAEPPRPPQVNAVKSKKSKKKSKKQTENQQPTTQFIESSKPDGTKMVTLRNPMFHANLPPVNIAQNPVKKPEARSQENVPLPANPCQATITPTSNGMYTIRNPLMSMMHQQSMMTQPPQINQMYQPNNYNYVNPNAYQPNQQPQAYVIDSSRQSPIANDKIDSQNRLLNLASFTQKNEEGYSLFKKEDSNNQKGFLNTDYYQNAHVPNPNVSFPPTVSPNPIGTRPEVRHYDQANDSLFTNNSIHRPEPIGTGLKKAEDDKNEFCGGLYTPFGQEDRNVFRNALFDSGVARNDDVIPNGDGLPYFQRLRAGSKLNNEVTIHHVTESKFYKNAEPMPPPPLETNPDPYCYGRQCWSVPSSNTAFSGVAGDRQNCAGAGISAAGVESTGASPLDEGFGPVGTRANPAPLQHDCQSMFHAARSLSDLTSAETMEAMQRYEQLYIQKQRMHQLNTN